MISLLLANWKFVIIAALLTLSGFLYLDVQHQKNALAASRLETATLRTAYAEAVQNATTEAMQKLQAETARGNALATQLITTKQDLEKARLALSGRIDHVASDVPASCVFDADFVLFWNDAFGATAASLPQVRGPGDPPGASAAASPPGSGVRKAEPVTVADVLANLRDNGSRCQAVEKQLVKLIELEGGKP